MIQRLKAWYPLLFALLPILNTLTRNPGGTRLNDAGVVLGVVLVASAAGYAVLRAVLRRAVPRGVIPLLMLVAILLFYGKTPVAALVRQVPAPAAVVFAVVGGLLAATIWWLARKPHLADRVNTFFALTGVLMVGWLGTRFIANLVRSQSLVRRSALAQELARPITVGAHAARTTASPDIYLIVLDEYANAAVLQEQFRFDNRPFEDSLRQLGFTIPKLVRSNYVHTVLSLPSLLNFSHLTRLTSEVGRQSTDATLPNYLLENNRAVTFLQRQGYQFLFFPSQWWPSTGRNRHADWQFDAWSGFSPGREASRSDLRRSLIRTTALDFVARDDTWDADFVRRTLSALEQVPQRSEQTFAFAHVVSPHWPYVFTPDCRAAPQRRIIGRAGRERGYTEQLQCLNQLLLHTVTAILQRSPVPPIILLQGDHGTNLLRYSDAASAAAVTPAQAWERLGAFGAYHLPGDGGRQFTDSVTIVNVLQKVLNYYYDAQIPPASDDLYVSLERTPYDFARVDPSALIR